MEGRPREDAGRARPSTREERGLRVTCSARVGILDGGTVSLCCVSPSVVFAEPALSKQGPGSSAQASEPLAPCRKTVTLIKQKQGSVGVGGRQAR